MTTTSHGLLVVDGSIDSEVDYNYKRIVGVTSYGERVYQLVPGASRVPFDSTVSVTISDDFNP